MCDLSGRTALISGAASGIGAATAKAFAEAGADVVLGWFPGDPHDVKPIRDAVVAAGRNALVCELDVTSTESVNAFADSAMSTFGKIDILVANAGI
ncbi:MAG: SDR family NAD(P)-dependent oxidoreductase, partial [Candidatus Dormibacteraceae bacterium]